RDTRIGITPELRRQLFEPSAQAPQTGLGLAMVKGLIELHGGSVNIHRTGSGQGTELTLSLPLEECAGEEAPARVASFARPRRVLVIEDHRDAAESLAASISLSGH